MKTEKTYEENLAVLIAEMKRAGCDVVSILKHRNGRISATFKDLMAKKKGWPNITTSYKNILNAIEYFKEIGDYIEDPHYFAPGGGYDKKWHKRELANAV